MRLLQKVNFRPTNRRIPVVDLAAPGSKDLTQISVRGFTLLEALIVALILAALSLVVLVRGSPQAGRSTAGQQAERVADELRQVQAMAMAQGRNLRFAANSGSYASYCVPVSSWRGGVATTSACADEATPIEDRPRGAPVSYTLDGGLVFESAVSLQFDTLGRLVGLDEAAEIHLSHGGDRMATIRVEPDTGHVSTEVLQ